MIGDPETVGSPNDGDLLTPTREAIAAARNQIQMERSFTVERIEQLRRFYMGKRLKAREKKEWRHFRDRVRPLEQAIEAMTKQAATYVGLREPPPIHIAIK